MVSQAQAHKGFPNKNVGDAFLMVWKPPDENEAAGLSGPELWDQVGGSCLPPPGHLRVRGNIIGHARKNM